jgi:hypothetical protein
MSPIDELARFSSTRGLRSGVGAALVVWLLAACTTLETYPRARLGPDLPLAPGDEVVLHFTDPQIASKTLKVRSFDTDGIRGELPWDSDTVEIHRWTSIEYIEQRRFSAGKTTVLALIGIVVIGAAKATGDALDHLFENIYGGAE